jgi:hypothetical protein
LGHRNRNHNHKKKETTIPLKDELLFTETSIPIPIKRVIKKKEAMKRIKTPSQSLAEKLTCGDVSIMMIDMR